jgi:hypothetical protein
MKKLPGFVDAPTAAQIEVDWVRLASGVGPKELDDATELALFLLDQDGPEPDQGERDRKRSLAIGKQGRDGTSQVTGWLTPEARATWEPIFAKYAAPGMCNPDDPEPCTSGTRRKPRSTTTTAAWPNANTTHSSPSGGSP